MRLYFAYGSNMHRRRLERRIGGVEDLGWARLDGYRHRFNKRGADGTAKGNIVVSPGGSVHGVLYRVSADQLDELARFEGGYRPVEVDVSHHRPRAAGARATTFEAIAPVAGLAPAADYLEHYRRGMLEHGLPETYRAAVLCDDH